MGDFLIKRQELILYAFVSLLDKGVSFLYPLLFLIFFGGGSVYNEIEYAFSISLIISIFADFGLKSYCPYGYFKAEQKDKYMFALDDALVVLLFFWSFVVLLLFAFGFNYIALFAVSRASYLIVYNYSVVRYRMLDKPVFPYVVSILFNTSFLLFVYLLNSYSQNEKLFLWMTSFIHAPLIFILVAKLSGGGFYRKNIIYLLESIRYAIPLILSALGTILILQFSKIYAYSFLAEEDMTLLSVCQRIALIVQLLHAIYCSYYQKYLMRPDVFIFSPHVFLRYIVVLLIGLIASLIFVFVYYTIVYEELIFFKLVSILLITCSTFVWCINAYVELFFNKNNKNKFIMISSFMSLFFYVTFVYFLQVSSLLGLSAVMCGTMLLAMGFQFLSYKYVKKTY